MFTRQSTAHDGGRKWLGYLPENDRCVTGVSASERRALTIDSDSEPCG